MFNENGIVRHGSRRLRRNYDTAHAQMNALRLAKDSGNATRVRELELNLTNYRNSLPLRDPGLVDGGAK
jgi:tRNA(Arg) A34 adenosine deaminase TadA